jgi:hypothetical protein
MREGVMRKDVMREGVKRDDVMCKAEQLLCMR